MDGKTRILHVVQAAGGVDRYLRMLLKYLDKEKFENIVILSQDFQKQDYLGLVDYYETVEMQRSIGKQDCIAICKVRELIKKYNPDIVYAHSSKAGAIVRIADIGLNNHCIYNPHGWAFNMKISSKKQKLYEMIEKLAAPFCEKIICISDAEKESALKKNICAENKLQVIYNGIDIKEYENGENGNVMREELGIPEDAIVIGMVGRISQQKAPDIFIRAARIIKNSIPKAFFTIVGNGEMEDEVKQYAKENGLEESLLITGWVQNPLDYIKIFDVAMLLSRWEGFGLVLPEYMVSGKPIVATECDAIPYIIEDGENGLLVDVDDPVSAANATVKICKNDRLRGKLIENGKIIVRQKFDAKRMAEESEMLFLEMVSPNNEVKELEKIKGENRLK